MQDQVLYALDLFGIAVFAVSGSLAADGKKMDIFGAIVLGFVTALGGGSFRDILLDCGPVFWVADLHYLQVAVVASILTFLIVRRLTLSRKGLLLSDAFGLAVFTLLGAAKTLDATGSGSLSVVMGIITGVAGGVIRDVLSAKVPLVLCKEVYATASLCGALVFVVMHRLALPGILSIILSILVTLSIRLAAIRWQLSLPLFVSKKS